MITHSVRTYVCMYVCMYVVLPVMFSKCSGHFLKPPISKVTILDKKFETYLERENVGNYFDTKFTVTAFCDGNLHVKEIIPTKPHYHTE